MSYISDTVAEWRIHDNGLSTNILQRGAMKARLLALFERLRLCLSKKNVLAVEAAINVIRSAQIVTYDDYVGSMAVARGVLHAADVLRPAPGIPRVKTGAPHHSGMKSGCGS